MATGGVLTVTGVALGAVFGLRGRTERTNLNMLYDQEEAQGCLSMTVPNEECSGITDDIGLARENGKRANLYMGVSLGVLGGIGLASLITGVVLFKKGQRIDAEQPEDEEFARVRLVPTFGGVSLTGRF